MRSTLTCMGIIIGIAAVIAMMEIGKGSSTKIANTMAMMGADNILVLPGTAQNGGISQGIGSVVTLHPQDCDAILRECSAVRRIAPLVKARVQLIYGNRNCNPGNMNGSTPDYCDIHNWPIADGEMFTDADVRSGNRVCVIGRTVVHELFEDSNPVGKFVRLNSVSFRVVGVLKTKGANIMGWDQDDVLIAPWTTIKFRINNQGSSGGAAAANSSVAQASQVNSISGLYPAASAALYPSVSNIQLADTPQTIRFANIDQILIAADSPQRVHLAMYQIRQLLRDRHRLTAGQPDDFNVRDLAEFADAMQTMNKTMTGLLLSVALISLLVGGVGIMNIMLVSVTERTREIGLRMAVGARSKDILRQFLIEAIILCVLGGIAGIALGRLTSVLVRKFMHWPTEVSIAAIVASVIVSASVGILFGFYPAWKASRLDPIEALRYE